MDLLVSLSDIGQLNIWNVSSYGPFAWSKLIFGHKLIVTFSKHE